MEHDNLISRRSTLGGIGAVGALACLGSQDAHGELTRHGLLGEAPESHGAREAIFGKVLATPLIDTHEHLLEEKHRLAGPVPPLTKCDDWAIIFSHYLADDMISAGMPRKDHDRFFSPKVDPLAKWTLIEPYWPAIRNTGYGLAVRVTLEKLYGVKELNAETVKQVQAGYEELRRPGFYRRILKDLCNLESCQCQSGYFAAGQDRAMPELLMSDLWIDPLFNCSNRDLYSKRAGIEVTSLAAWHRVIEWWLDQYHEYIVALKTSYAYFRKLDYERVPANGKVEASFGKLLNDQPLSGSERKLLQDHLFWHTLDKAAEHHLPVKIHTGYYAGSGNMPLGRLASNPASAADLCQKAPGIDFVFMHICYPYYEDMIALAKHYRNAHLDMCWSWIINPIASKDFLKKYLVTAPANKVLTFGGDYIPVEPVVGHATMARQGIAQAMSELIEEGWLGLNDALDLVDLIMHQNARRIFRINERKKLMQNVKW